ncbi:TRAP transporter substrate-binding protein [Candidatus Pacearchaeota archaeon]|nr:TRAP transporter substrate-binding protein [Candidatus Pacearchaeota archaeon]
MNNFNIVAVILVLLCVSLLFTGCSDKEDVFIMKIDSAAPLEEPGSQALLRYAELVNERSEGRIRAILYPAGALGMNRDVTEGLQLGTIEVQMASNSPLAVFVPSLNIFELPFLFENNEHMFAVLDSEIGRSYIPDLEKHGFHLLGYFTYGVRHIMTTRRSVGSIEDLKGLKIRTMESPVHLDAFKAFGANPLPMAYNELFVALQTGMIDGAEAANSNYYSKRFFEVAPNWAQVGWIRLVAPIIMGKKFYDKLPPDLQKIVDESLQELVDYERNLYTEVDEQRLEQLKAAGVKITYPDRVPFIEASKKVYDKWADKVGGSEKIQAIVDFEY